MLLDAASLYFRAFHGVPESITAPDGTPVNAVRGFVDMVAVLVTKFRPARLVACLDADWRPAFRVDAIASYKAHRLSPAGGEESPATLTPQVPVIEDVLAAVGLAQLGIPGYEADDVIGTLVARESGPVDVVTGDRDLFQLVDDRGPVRVLYTGRGVRNLEVLDEAAVEKRYGIPGRAYGEFAVLRGDPSDGLPGVPGIGEKTAAALIRRFGSVDAMLAELDAGATEGFPAGSRTRLAAARDYLAVAPVVVRVAPDAPVPPMDDRLPAAPTDPPGLVELCDRWGLDSSVERLLRALEVAHSDH
ncbi:MAG: flap endonuclease [Actinomycetota bacterium]|nr:flap endonuclease [Actinomycetota bacterium]